jgi:hypothetical protein
LPISKNAIHTISGTHLKHLLEKALKMSGNRPGYGGGGRNPDEHPDQQQYDPLGNPVPRNDTYPTGSFPEAFNQSGLPGFAVPQPPNMLMGGFPQQPPNPHGINPSQIMGGHQGHLSQAMPPQNRHHGALPPDSSIHRAMTPPWPSIQGVMYGQQPSYPTMQNTLQPSAGVLFPPLIPTGAFPQPSSASTSAINQFHTLGNSAFDMQQAVVAPPFIPNPPVLPDPASAFDDDYVYPRTGRPTRPFLPHEQALLRQYYRLRHPLAPNATDREIQMWHIRLRSTELTAWEKFVTDNESKSQAVERAEAIEDYEEWVNDIKQSMRDEIRSNARGNVYNRLGRAPGSKNKPKTAPPAAGTGMNKAKSRKGGSVLKGKKSRNQLDSGKCSHVS